VNYELRIGIGCFALIVFSSPFLEFFCILVTSYFAWITNYELGIGCFPLVVFRNPDRDIF